MPLGLYILEGREAPAYFLAPTSFLLKFGWWVVCLSVNVKVPLSQVRIQIMFFSCRKRRLGLETYLERTMVDSIVDRSTKSVDGICRPTESADGMCKPTECADEIFRPTESADRQLDTLSYLRQGCCTYAGLLYLRTDGGVSYLRRGAAVLAYAREVSYRCARGAVQVRGRGAVQVREREMGRTMRRKTERCAQRIA